MINNCRNHNFRAIHRDHQLVIFATKVFDGRRTCPQIDKSFAIQYLTTILLAKAKLIMFRVDFTGGLISKIFCREYKNCNLQLHHLLIRIHLFFAQHFQQQVFKFELCYFKFSHCFKIKSINFLFNFHIFKWVYLITLINLMIFSLKQLHQTYINHHFRLFLKKFSINSNSHSFSYQSNQLDFKFLNLISFDFLQGQFFLIIILYLAYRIRPLAQLFFQVICLYRRLVRRFLIFHH